MNRLAEELLDHLKLNPNQISKDSLRFEITPGDLVIIRWDGWAMMNINEFRQICDASS